MNDGVSRVYIISWRVRGRNVTRQCVFNYLMVVNNFAQIREEATAIADPIVKHGRPFAK